MPLVGAGRRRRCPAFMPAVLRATRACVIRPTRPPSRRSSRSCRSPATVCTVGGCAGWSSCCGARVFGSTKRSPCARPTSIAAAAHYLSGTARAGDVVKSGWTIGDGRSSSRGSLPGSRCRSVRCFASSTDGPAAGRGAPAERAPSFDGPPLEPACADGSLRISCATPTRSRWPAKACPGSSFSASSVTATSGSPRSICRASTTPKSSKRSTPGAPMIAVSASPHSY